MKAEGGQITEHHKVCMKLVCSQLTKLLMEKESEDQLLFSYSSLVQIAEYQIKNNNRIVGQIQYLPFINKEGAWLALIDGGLQVNMIEEKLITKFEFEVITAPPFFLYGVFENKVNVEKGIRVKIRLPQLKSKKSIGLPMAVVHRLACRMLLHMPFLRQIRDKQDFHMKILNTIYGSVQLVIEQDFEKEQQLITLYITKIEENKEEQLELEKNKEFRI